MEVIVFSSSLLVLVNGSPKGYFLASKGLRQSDLLSPFNFLLMAEGLVGLMRSGCDF